MDTRMTAVNEIRRLTDIFKVVVLCGWLDRHRWIIVAKGLVYADDTMAVRKVVDQCDRCGTERKRT